MQLDDQVARKNCLKDQLKLYAAEFQRNHGRMLVKSENEPIRYLYVIYNSLKSQISHMEQERMQLALCTFQPTVSSSSGSDGGDASGSPSVGPPPAARAPRKLPKPSTTPPIGAGAGDLAALKVEKGNLHRMLRSFEKEFFRENSRQVSIFADIKPMVSQYRRHREITKAIAELQQGEK
jgi:hypothetical protein